jgi:hypothetical protein
MRKSLLFLILVLSRLTDPNPPDKKAIRCFRFTFNVPMIDKQGKYLGSYLASDRRMFLCGNLMMVEGVIESMEHIPPDSNRYFKSYTYLVFQRDSALGIKYETAFPDSSRRYRTDSVLALLRLNEGLPLELIGRQPHLVVSTNDKSSGTRTETYTRLGDSAQRDEDTCVLVFADQLTTLPWYLALSPTLDSARGSRLVSIKCSFGRQYSPVQKMMIDPYTFSWKMEEQAFFNRDSALLYFDRYWQDTHRVH